jgi:hypothetical protein
MPCRGLLCGLIEAWSSAARPAELGYALVVSREAALAALTAG